MDQRKQPCKQMPKSFIRVLFRRRVFVIFTILIQLGFILSAIVGSGLMIQYVHEALKILSVIVCLYILNKKDKPGYKLTWIFLILLFPIFGGCLYLVFCSQGNSGVLRRRMARLNEKVRGFYLLGGDVLPALTGKEYVTQARYLQNCAGYPVYDRTQTEYFDSGEGFFRRLLEELEKGEKYIFLEFFILREGLMLNPILEILKRKARQGLDVRLMYDDLGCFMSLPPNFRRDLEKSNIRCLVFNPFTPLLSSLQNNRDHRKIVSIDGKVAFTGGVNLADEYINAYDRFGHWKDAAILLAGAGAWSFTLIFLHLWNLESPAGAEEDYSAFYPWKTGPGPGPSAGYVQPYADNPMELENVGEHVYLQIINNAKEYVYINTPYLVVDDNLVSALTLSAKSGVDVRIITPHRWDKEIVALTSRSYYRQLVSAGVKVYEYTAGFNHSKTFVSDDVVAAVGTINLDFRSLYLHFECGVCIYENPGVAAVKKDFLATLPKCHEITLAECSGPARQRILQDVLRLFAPFM
ncbi:MAG: cardiolipin synthase [Spirochaetaceae bacterium]|jgi:cardiolipin synthase|nr:cardiolipin synthase [Spirochaetaceae bacterium]